MTSTTSVHDRNVMAIEAHESRKRWLDTSQKLRAYIQTMEDFSHDVD